MKSQTLIGLWAVGALLGAPAPASAARGDDCVPAADSLSVLCAVTLAFEDVRVVELDGRTRIEGIRLNDGREGALEISDGLLHGGAVLYDIVDGRVQLTGFRDLALIVEVDGRRTGLDIEVLDPVRITSFATDDGLGLHVATERDTAPMSWALVGHDFEIETRETTAFTLNGSAAVNRVRLALESTRGYTRVESGDYAMVAANGRDAFIELTYQPGTVARATDSFRRLLVRDGVDLNGLGHLNRSGTLTVEGAAGPLEGSLSLFLPDGTLPSSAAEVRGLMLRGGLRWKRADGWGHSGFGVGVLPISVLTLRAQGFFDEGGALDGERRHDELPLTLVTELYSGSSTRSSHWRYHLAAYRNAAYDHPSEYLFEPSEGGVLAAATFWSADSVFAAVLANDEHRGAARFQYNLLF